MWHKLFTRKFENLLIIPINLLYCVFLCPFQIRVNAEEETISIKHKLTAFLPTPPQNGNTSWHFITKILRKVCK